MRVKTTPRQILSTPSSSTILRRQSMTPVYGWTGGAPKPNCASFPESSQGRSAITGSGGMPSGERLAGSGSACAVSYTHLTLPTKRIV